MYSQNLEEKHILKYFEGKKGTFLDIGANDGVTLSNTRALFDLGWNGVLVEPSPEAFSRLKQNYRALGGIYLYNFALGSHNGMMKFYDSGSHLKNGDIGLLSTGSEEDYNKWRPTTEFKEIEVKVFRWKTFLNRLKLKEFDFISCDAESMDYDILIQIDLFSTSLVCIEHNGDANLKTKILEYTSKFGLKNIIYTSGENIIIAR